jgi:hypothetical protein
MPVHEKNKVLEKIRKKTTAVFLIVGSARLIAKMAPERK